MHLSQLLEGIAVPEKKQDPWITGLCQDSRQLQPGDLFFAYPGNQYDGRNFLNVVIEKGAAAILYESKGGSALFTSPIPLIPLAELTAYLSLIAARFYQHPSQDLSVVGITGTNGKTSCTHFLADCLQQLGQPCGVMGTLGNGVYQQLKPSVLTTPDAIELQQCLAAFRAQNVQTVFMEVSSHRLAQQRLNGMQFSIAAFTNLTRDHLDYHGSMAAYAQAKRSLFALPGVQQAVLNGEDPYGQKWLQELSGQLPLLAYSVTKLPSSLRSIPHVVVKHSAFHSKGLQAEIATPWGDIVIENPFLLGKFNLSNLLLVLTVLKLLGFSLATISDVLAKVQGVPGRLQAFRTPGLAWVVIDYAHTPDALQQVLSTLRAHCAGTLYCVFGCGGNRDKGKRALMGEIAERYADSLVLTNDNPRFEDPEQIIRDIQQGLSGSKPVFMQQDRRRAITYAIQHATAEDIVLVAGKGHETYQLIGGKKYPFSDALEVQRLLDSDRG
jgi:UDP-N-acetylmuramoyl-L-alanyl-D-glutamate--2,6-diaminopimelate ligase